MTVGICQATGCGKSTSPRTRMFCPIHYAILPTATQTEINNVYKRGVPSSTAQPTFEEINRAHIKIDINIALADLTRL